MPLRLDNAKGVAHMPTAGAAKNKSFEPRFKIDHAASQMPETRQPERLAPRATSNRNGGRDHLGILGEIKSVHPGEIIGIGNLDAALFPEQHLLAPLRRKHDVVLALPGRVISMIELCFHHGLLEGSWRFPKETS